jgi:phosphoribosyl-AMP cyclohydrolase
VRQNPPICYIIVKMLKDIKFNKDGLTLSSGEAWFYSRSRQELWHKGETSGSIIKVSSVFKDCDSDTILIKGKASGPVCHTGNRTCFFQELTEKDIKA